jgi:hypothetical protein
MVDVEAYHMLHREEISDSKGEGSALSDRRLDQLRQTKDFLLQLPPTIQGFNMTEKKWSKYAHAHKHYLADSTGPQSP